MFVCFTFFSCVLCYTFCDNISVKHLAANLINHARMKHVELDWHFFSQQMLLPRHSTSFVFVLYFLNSWFFHHHELVEGILDYIRYFFILVCNSKLVSQLNYDPLSLFINSYIITNSSSIISQYYSWKTTKVSLLIFIIYNKIEFFFYTIYLIFSFIKMKSKRHMLVIYFTFLFCLDSFLIIFFNIYIYVPFTSRLFKRFYDFFKSYQGQG